MSEKSLWDLWKIIEGNSNVLWETQKEKRKEQKIYLKQ